MENRTVLKIASIGLQATEQKVLEVAAFMVGDGGVDCQLVNGDTQAAHIVVADIDEQDAVTTVATKLKEPQVKILLSQSKNAQGKNTVNLHKPVRVIQLKDILVQICSQLHEHFQQHMEQVLETMPEEQANKNDPSDLSNNAPRNAFELLLKAKQDGNCIKLSNNSLPDMFVNGNAKTVLANGDQSTFKKYYEITTDELNNASISEQDLHSLAKGLTPHALDAELWQSGVMCSNGKILPGHNSEEPVKLSAWPNFTRNGFKPEFFKIAAAMAKQPVSLNEVSKAAQVQLDLVIDFYNAAFAVDLIIKESGEAESSFESRKLKSDRKTLLGKLAQRLKLA